MGYFLLIDKSVSTGGEGEGGGGGGGVGGEIS